MRGEWYVEAHHVLPLPSGRAGTDTAANVVTVCATHRRQLDYGGVGLEDGGAHFASRLPKAAQGSQS
jgi:hypothetical protein